MPKRVQRVGHPTTQANEFLGLEREITVDTTAKSLRVHDGVLKGGYETARKDLNNVANATQTNPGKMTAAQVIQLDTASADILTNAANIATNASNIATNASNISALQTFRNYFPNINAIVSGNADDLNLLTGKSGTNIALMRGLKTGATEPTKTYMYNTVAPTGWIAANPDTNVRGLTIGNTSPGTIGGTMDPDNLVDSDLITINFPATTGGHGLTASENGPHAHNVTAGTAGVAGPAGWESAGGPNATVVSQSSGSGTPHSHTIGGSGSDTANITMTPRYARGLIAQLDS